MVIFSPGSELTVESPGLIPYAAVFENVTTSLGELFSAAKSAVRILVILAG